MNIAFVQTVEDLVEFNRCHWQQSPTLRRQYLGCLALGPLTFGGMWLLLVLNSEGSAGGAVLLFVICLVLALLSTVGMAWLYRWNIMHNVKGLLGEGTNRTILGPHEVSIAPDAIVEKSELVETTRKWQAIEKIVVFPDTAAFYESSVTAVLVPRRAFTSDADFDRFVATAREYHAAACGSSDS